jgi:hypothetical protein
MASPLAVFGPAGCPAFTKMSNGQTGIRQIVEKSFPAAVAL